jgi:hypothetical protein
MYENWTVEIHLFIMSGDVTDKQQAGLAWPMYVYMYNTLTDHSTEPFMINGLFTIVSHARLACTPWGV